MKTLKFDDRDSWLVARRGKITGSRLKDIIVKRGTGYKIGFYELIAEKIAIAPDGENVMDRGNRLEDEGIAKLSEKIGKKIDTSLVIWTRDDDENIAVSPDGVIGKTEAAEIKCLSSARHLEAFLTKAIPDEFEFQRLQYFIVNDKLKKLYFGFYDPRMPENIQFFFIEVKREDVQADIDLYLEYQRKVIQEVNQIVNDLTF
jgi:predicted phage-related endonuclease